MRIVRSLILLLGCWLALTALPLYAQKIRVIPKDAINFGCVPAGDTGYVSITIFNDEPVEEIIVNRFEVDFDGKPPVFIAPGGSSVKIRPRQSYTDIVRFVPRGPGQQTWMADLDIYINGRRRHHIDLIGETGPPRRLFVVNNDTVLVWSTAIGETKELCLSLRNPSCGDIPITSITFTDPASYRLASTSPTSASDTVGPDVEKQLCIELTPSAATKDTSFMRIHVANRRPMDIMLIWKEPPFSIKSTPRRALQFDTTLITTTSDTRIVDFYNEGGSPVNVIGWDVVGSNADEFTISPPTIPATLLGNRANTLRYSVQFEPSAVGPRNAELRIFLENETHFYSVGLRGVGTTGGVDVSSKDIDLGSTLVDTPLVANDTLTIRNTGVVPVDIQSITIRGNDSARFTILDKFPVTIPAQGTVSFDVQFIPDSARSYTVTTEIQLSSGPGLTVILRGRGDELERTYHFRLDSTAEADVNNPIPIVLHVEPALAEGDNITSYTVRLRVDHTSLFPRRVYGPNTQGVTFFYPAADTIEITRPEGPVVKGTELFTLELEGLVTGKPTNIVEVVDLELSTSAQISIGGNALIRLNGCDVGDGLGFGRPVMVNSLHPSPAADRATIRYTAPSGSVPTIRIVDITGSAILNASLPTGTGVEQETTLAVQGLAPGLYFLELRSGTGRDTIPLLVRQ